MTIRHIVTWQMAAEDPETRAEHADKIARDLRALVGVVPEILSLSVGRNAVSIDGNSDLALVADFADEEALQAYGAHPAHQEVVAYVRTVVGGRSAVDFEV